MHDPAARSPLPRFVVLALALLVAGTLVLEYLLVLRATWAEAGPLRASIRYFSYFTILSNIAVLLVCVSVLSGAPAFFTRPAVRGAVTVYIGLTGVLYALLLRNTWDPRGLALLTDVSLHYVVPVLSVLAWLAGPGHGALQWRHAVALLAFPVAYLAWVLLRGAKTGEYPYPFVDVADLGLPAVLANTAALLVVFLVAGLLLVLVDRLVARHLLPARATS